MVHILQAFPLLYLNLGGELLYIIEQRLQAQDISAEKSVKGRRKKNTFIYFAFVSMKIVL